jgi:hypothetical protein
MKIVAILVSERKQKGFEPGGVVCYISLCDRVWFKNACVDGKHALVFLLYFSDGVD